MSEKAKPCPFCGCGSVSIKRGDTHRWVVAECVECGARGPEARRDTMAMDKIDDMERALAAWNERPCEGEA